MLWFACCWPGCLGGDGYPSFVTGSSIPTTCAPGGCGGKQCCFTDAYTCHPSFVYSCGTGDWGLPRVTGSAKRSQYCHNQMWTWTGGTPIFGGQRKSKDWCAGNFTNTGSCLVVQQNPMVEALVRSVIPAVGEAGDKPSSKISYS